MGRFVNPDNSAFQVALNSRIYVDKTGLIEYTNSVLDTTNAYICNSRPRRFGKSYAANMLVAYYSKGVDSEKMFSGLQISREADFKKHLNKYDVIRVTLEHNCIIKKHKIQRLPQVSCLRHFAVCTKNTENILEKEREKGIMSEKV